MRLLTAHVNMMSSLLQAMRKAKSDMPAPDAVSFSPADRNRLASFPGAGSGASIIWQPAVVLQVATGLAAGCLPQGSCAARIMLLVGGPATAGPGKVVDMELSEPIRWAYFVYWLVGHCGVPHRGPLQLCCLWQCAALTGAHVS